MDFYAQYKKLSDKLAETLAEEKLLHVFSTDKYPITLTVRQNQAPDAQMELYSTKDGSISSQDAVLRLIFNLDKMNIQTDERLVISEELFNKIKNSGKKIHDAYCRAYFADRRNAERLRLYGDPDVAEDKAGAYEDAGSFDGFYDQEEAEAENDGAGV